MAEPSDSSYIGRPMKRVEDRKLLIGAGRYVDDFRLPGLLHVAFLRCPHAHARIQRLNVDAAHKAPGVVALLTGAEVRHLGPMPVNRIFPDMKVPPHPILAESLVHAAGVPVAAVATESPYEARDAIEMMKDLEKEKMIDEDELYQGRDEVQKLTDTFIERIDEIGKAKKAEIMEV